MAQALLSSIKGSLSSGFGVFVLAVTKFFSKKDIEVMDCKNDLIQSEKVLFIL